MTDDPVIKPIDNGPLMVANPPDMIAADGAVIETGARAVLCRCGLSKKKPFCDGSHKAAAFTSSNDGVHPRNRALDYAAEVEGADVTVSYTPMLCSHAAECQRLHGAVFDPAKKPWVQPEHGTLAGLRAVVAACPSGALRLAESRDAAPSHIEPDADDIAISVTPNGPYAVRNVPLEAEFNGVGASTRKYVLCRCGQSKNKPFCDGSHHDENWRDDAAEAGA